jgi:hypothetical protein
LQFEQSKNILKVVVLALASIKDAVKSQSLVLKQGRVLALTFLQSRADLAGSPCGVHPCGLWKGPQWPSTAFSKTKRLNRMRLRP